MCVSFPLKKERRETGDAGDKVTIYQTEENGKVLQNQCYDTTEAQPPEQRKPVLKADAGPAEHGAQGRYVHAVGGPGGMIPWIQSAPCPRAESRALHGPSADLPALPVSQPPSRYSVPGTFSPPSPASATSTQAELGWPSAT